MKVVLLRAFGGVENFCLSDLPVPEPDEGEVRIRLCAAAFNPVDYKFRQGRFGGTVPMILGFDAAGVVDAVGDQVSEPAVGEEVYAYLGGRKSNGSYAEYVCVPAAFVARKPANISLTQAAAIPLAGLTAYQSVMHCGLLDSDRSVFVAGGAGGVGSIAIQLLQHLGADPILTTAGNDASADYLTRKLHIPVERILRYRGLSAKQLRDQTLAMNNGRPVAAAFDFWGGEMKRLCCSVLGFDGRMVSIVEEPPGFDLNVWNASRSPLFARSASLHFEFVGARAMFGGPETWLTYRTQLQALARLIEAGQVTPTAPTEVGRLSAEAVRNAHTELESGHVQGKLVMSIP